MRIATLLSALILVISGAGMDQTMAQAASPSGEGSRNPAYQNEVLGVSLRALPPNTRVREHTPPDGPSDDGKPAWASNRKPFPRF